MVFSFLKFGYLLASAGNFYGDVHDILLSGKNLKDKKSRSPKFLSKHYFSKFEFSSSNGFTSTFKDSVNGIDPKIRGKYYVEWVDGDYFDWQNHVRDLNSKHDKSDVEAILNGRKLSFWTLREVCDSYANKKLEVVGNNSNFTFKHGGKEVKSLSDLQEWKNAVSVCTRTIRLEDYMQKAYLDKNLIEGKEIIVDAEDISDEALKLRDDDTKTDKNSSLTYGKEYLQDRLRGLSNPEAKKHIFKWCRYLGNKAASVGIWNNDKDNFATYCMKSQGSSSKNRKKRSLKEVTVRQPKERVKGNIKTVGDYLQQKFIDTGDLKNKKIVTSVKEISDSVWSLRQDDERNYEKAGMFGKEFLQDRLKEKSLDLVKEEVFKWCEFLKTRPISTKERNLHNLWTYCLVNK